ncbi:DsbA family protein [Aureimonas fodinaquatilis]|uniref:DsbA family protein n=1 Tax=Aureimonas fodinaquatilis TaxID=2565783 RepID=A0A5B0DZC4_9HYPH|nr:DsbA family protein [Aureimonas fodinaquatilis]
MALLLSPLSPALAQNFDDSQKTEIEEIIRNYLIAQPEVLVEAMTALEAKRTAEQREGQKAAIAMAGETLFQTAKGAELGNPEGDVTIVEFFDYNCGYCKRAHADMLALIDSDPNLRVVLKEAPVLGPDSAAASRVSLAFREIMPERYGEFHSKLLMSRTPGNEERALEVARELGASEADIRAAMQNREIDTELRAVSLHAMTLQITGTPSYVVGDEVVIGAVGADELAAKIANVRQCGSATCS